MTYALVDIGANLHMTASMTTAMPFSIAPVPPE